jgi:hypothetical protein
MEGYLGIHIKVLSFLALLNANLSEDRSKKREEICWEICNDPDRPPEMGSMVARLLD